MKLFITGTAGFIGFHVARELLKQGHEIIGIDNLTPYYDVTLKENRLKILKDFKNFTEIRENLANKEVIENLFKKHQPQRVINLAAQAGVRHSLKAPHDYVESNISGFLNILEGCRHNEVEHLVYASSSSVYGANETMPFSEHQSTEHPMSFYAASKKANEMMAHSYSNLFNLPTTGLRFFTVYGPWGRPDMAIFLFADAIAKGKPINVFNHGKMQRDFTFIDDICQGIIKTMERPSTINKDWNAKKPDTATSGVGPYKIYNIGNNKPVELMTYISLLEKELGIEAEKNMLPMQAGDVPATWADSSELIKDTGYTPSTSVEDGIKEFVKWYKEYYKI